MVEKSFKPSNLTKPQQGRPDQEIGITSKASTEDNHFKMILTTYILGIAVLGVIIVLTMASIRDHDELFWLKFFLIIACALLAMRFMFMYFKIEEKKTAEMEERKKTMSGVPENTSIVISYGTVIPIPIP